MEMCHQIKVLSDAILLAKLMEPHAIKLPVIIYNYNLGKTISVNNRSSNEIPHHSFGDVDKWLSFNPLSNVVYNHQNKLTLSSYPRKCTKDVHYSLGKRPRSSNWSQKHCQLMLNDSICLVMLTLLYKFSYILQHSGSIVVLPKYLVG